MIIGHIFPKLINGEEFKRTLSVKSFDCFLRNISNDYGNDRLLISLSGLKKHIDYIKDKGDSKIKLRKVYQEYLNEISASTNNLNLDEKEQTEITKHFEGNKRDELIKELNDSTKTEVETITVKSKSYKRNNKVIALIKILRDHKCQICDSSILKKDGSKYIEAAHIIPKHKKGNETPENILLLCPNHHKEFDLGNRVVKKHDSESVEFILNGIAYKLNLSIR